MQPYLPPDLKAVYLQNSLLATMHIPNYHYSTHMEMPRLSQGGHKVVTRWSQGRSIITGCHKVSHKVVTRLVTRLSQGCQMVITLS